MKKLFMMIIFLGAFVSYSSAVKTIKLSGTLRDFNQDYVDFEPHMNWENNLYAGKYRVTDGLRGGLKTGYVLDTLDNNKKPQINSASTDEFTPANGEGKVILGWPLTIKSIVGGGVQKLDW